MVDARPKQAYSRPSGEASPRTDLEGERDLSRDHPLQEGPLKSRCRFGGSSARPDWRSARKAWIRGSRGECKGFALAHLTARAGRPHPCTARDGQRLALRARRAWRPSGAWSDCRTEAAGRRWRSGPSRTRSIVAASYLLSATSCGRRSPSLRETLAVSSMAQWRIVMVPSSSSWTSPTLPRTARAWGESSTSTGAACQGVVLIVTLAAAAGAGASA
jgi:hypothetical protein